MERKRNWKLGELGEVSFRMLKLGELGEMSFGMLKLGELGEVSFGKYKLGELDKVSFGILKTTVVVKQNVDISAPFMGKKCGPKTPTGIPRYSRKNKNQWTPDHSKYADFSSINGQEMKT